MVQSSFAGTLEMRQVGKPTVKTTAWPHNKVNSKTHQARTISYPLNTYTGGMQNSSYYYLQVNKVVEGKAELLSRSLFSNWCGEKQTWTKEWAAEEQSA